MDIKLDLDPLSAGFGDALFINRPLTKEDVTQPFTENVAQRLRIRLLTFEEEWFLDTTYGVPYWQRILGKKPTKSAVDQILQQEVLSENGVKEIVSFTSSFVNRKYSASFQVRVVNGEVTDTININPVN